MRTTILGGILFLVPLVFVAIVLGKAFQISMIIAKPLGRLFPLDRVIGIAVADVIAVLLLLFVCFLAGLLAQRSRLSSRLSKVDNFLIDIIPGYAVVKGVLGGVANQDDAMSVLHPVLVKFDDYEQIAFEVERDAKNAAIFLPGSPSAWSGASIIVELNRVTSLNLPPHQAVSLLRVMGRGSLKLNAVRLQGNPVTATEPTRST